MAHHRQVNELRETLMLKQMFRIVKGFFLHASITVPNSRNDFEVFPFHWSTNSPTKFITLSSSVQVVNIYQFWDQELLRREMNRQHRTGRTWMLRQHHDMSTIAVL